MYMYIWPLPEGRSSRDGEDFRTGERWLPGTPASTIAEGLVQGATRGGHWKIVALQLHPS